MPPLGQDDRSSAERVEALQRQLDDMMRQDHEATASRAAKRGVVAFLEVSAALMFMCVAAMVYLQRRAAKV